MYFAPFWCDRCGNECDHFFKDGFGKVPFPISWENSANIGESWQKLAFSYCFECLLINIVNKLSFSWEKLVKIGMERCKLAKIGSTLLVSSLSSRQRALLTATSRKNSRIYW